MMVVLKPYKHSLMPLDPNYSSNTGVFASNQEINSIFIHFSQNRKVPYQNLEDDCDRRVMGHSTKVKQKHFQTNYIFNFQYEMVNGKFELPDEITSRQFVDGKYSLAPLYKVRLISRSNSVYF